MRALMYSAISMTCLLFPTLATAGAGEIIILGGGADSAAAQKAIDAYAGLGLKRLEPAEGYPRIVDSGTVPGLNKGFQIAVLGFCAAEGAVARQARDLLNLDLGGVYTKPVKAALPKACPKLRGARATGLKEFAEVGAGPFGRAFPTLEYRVFQRDFPKLESGDSWTGPMVVVRLMQGDRLVSELELGGSARAGDDEGDYGNSSSWKFDRFVDDGARTYVWLTSGSYGGDTGTLAHDLFGFACGGIRNVYEIGSQFDPCCGPPESFSIEAGAEKETLRVVHVDPAREETEEIVRFDAARCRLR